MRQLVRRHLGKVVAGTALAVAGAAVVVGTALPDSGDSGDRANAASGQQNAIPKDGVVEDAPQEGDRGIGSDPLTDAETARAEKIALNSGDMRSSARDVEGDRGPQRLSTNLAESEPSESGEAAPRRADIVYYDYKKDSVVTKTVNLDTGKVEDTTTAQNVQPPPSQEELREGAELLMADPLGKGLKKDFEHATGKELSGPGQLDLSGFVFRKETVERVPSVLDDCGRHRCLQVVTKVKKGPWIDTRSLVVDLSARKVGRLG